MRTSTSIWSLLALALAISASTVTAGVMCEKITACVSGNGVTTCETFIVCDDDTIYPV